MTLDHVVLAGYLLLTTLVGCAFYRRTRTSERFMEAGRALPGWAVGLSVFGSYVSSISFLANPGKAYGSDWNAFVFALSLPIVCALAANFFLPYFRHSGTVSAYEPLERRFGPWARVYAVACYILLQVARLGTILYLLALALQPMLGVEMPILLVGLALFIVIYPMLGGTEATVWAGVVQSVVLLAGPVICIVALVRGVPGGVGAILSEAGGAGKWGLGTFAPVFTGPSFWGVFLYGLVTHLANFGADQGYVQRFLTARSDRAAVRSLWGGGLLYIPVAGLFFFIGTALWVFYRVHPESLPAGIKPDAVFPHFIQAQLPTGLRGLVLAALCAAAMDSNLNSLATLFLEDIALRWWRPGASERLKVTLLRGSVAVFGLLALAAAFAMIGAKTALDAWWEVAGVFGGGLLGLFLLARFVPAADSGAARWGVGVGVAVILWMTLSPKPGWPSALPQNHLHANLTMVLGTLAIVGVGLFAARARTIVRRTGEAPPSVP